MKYPKIPHYDNINLRLLKENFYSKGNVIYPQEKIDGSNFRIWKDNDIIYAGSRTVDFGDISKENIYYDETFKHIIAYIRENLPLFKDILPNGAVLFGEYLSKQKHLTIEYERIPKNHLIIFDMFYDGRYLKQSEYKGYANELGFEVVREYPIITNIKNDIELSQKAQEILKDTKSMLGNNVKPEGIVFKNYDKQFEFSNNIILPAVKYVRDEFQEEFKQVKHKENHITITRKYIGQYVSYPRFKKIINRLKEENKEINYENVSRAYFEDMFEENKERIINDFLYKFKETWNQFGNKGIQNMINNYYKQLNE